MWSHGPKRRMGANVDAVKASPRPWCWLIRPRSRFFGSIWNSLNSRLIIAVQSQSCTYSARGLGAARPNGDSCTRERFLWPRGLRCKKGPHCPPSPGIFSNQVPQLASSEQSVHGSVSQQLAAPRPGSPSNLQPRVSRQRLVLSFGLSWIMKQRITSLDHSLVGFVRVNS